MSDFRSPVYAVRAVPIDKVKANDYNPNVVSEDILAKLRAEISQKGLCEPIHVRSRGDGYEIVDGFHRWQICRDLGWEEVPCIIQDYDDNEAKIKTLQLYLNKSPKCNSVRDTVFEGRKLFPLSADGEWGKRTTKALSSCWYMTDLREGEFKEIEGALAKL